MPILPLAAAVTVLLDGRPVSAYVRAFASAGRTYAPLAPYVTRVADRLSYDGSTLVIVRGARSVRLRLIGVAPDALDREYVAIAPLLRDLGESVGYDARRRTVEVDSPSARVVTTPAPFDPNAPQVAPRVVFTPTPIPAPPLVWHGTPAPRRTPLPFPEPT